MIHEQIVLFEDLHSRGKLFKPLNYTRSFAELLTGAQSAIERITDISGALSQIVLHAKPELAPVIKKKYSALKVNELVQSHRTIFINSRLLITEHLLAQFRGSEDTLFTLEDNPEEILAFNLGTIIPKSITEKIASGEAIKIEDLKVSARALPKAKLFTSLWNMVNSNPVIIQSDIKRITALNTRIFHRDLKSNQKLDIANLKNVFIDQRTPLYNRVSLQSTDGPIYIEENVTIEPNVTIIGPVVIRAGSLIKAGAKIHPGVTVGPVSKIGGEVENSIIQGYSNKQHDGYLGHSYLGEWCNLGAGTNTSDLKNDYSNVRINIEGEEIETKSLFVGLLMGDHSKSAIGTQFNTGTVVGVSSNIFCSGFPPKWIPNFSWCGPNGIEKYRMEKALEVAKIVMARRKKEISEEEETFLKSLYPQ
jgi:UDP-N-acetylglucosamine diphosphorylase/glucosamine-1-phosphate N-acetyltransferase